MLDEVRWKTKVLTQPSCTSNNTQITANQFCFWMVWTSKICKACQRLLVHLLRLGQLALISIEKAQVVDSAECGGMARAPCFFLAIQCSLIHLLRLDQLALIKVENAHIMKSTITVFIFDSIKLFSIVKLLHTSIGMWE